MGQERAIPLTPPGDVWSQREYVACAKLGIGFAAHRAGDLNQYFHYRFPTDEKGQCTTVEVGPMGVVAYHDHGFAPDITWITQCVTAMTQKRKPS